eukprot:Partr_v1_DN26026_c0_g1_i2_m436 putative DnaJ (Hsp40) homolog subfamily C member
MIIAKQPTPHCVFECVKCKRAMAFDYPNARSRTDTAVWTVKCGQCSTVHSIKNSQDAVDPYGRLLFTSNSPAVSIQQDSSASGGGVVSRSVDNSEYYAVLNVDKSASADAIKKAYYKLAMKHHPDKYHGPDVAENEEKFKLISQAYQILGDPQLRERYDKYGKEDKLQPDQGFADPEALFQQLFGGDAFVDLIGDLALSRDMGDAMSSGSPNADNMMPAEERQKLRGKRVLKLTQNLQHKIASYVEHPVMLRLGASAMEKQIVVAEFEKKISRERDELRNASYGVELLHAIGFMYALKSRQWLGKEDTIFGIGKFWNDIREKGHMISETVGTIKSAVELQSALRKLETPEDGDTGKPAVHPLTAEEKSFWEQKAAQKGVDTIWKGSKMEIQGILRDVCDLLLSGLPLESILDENFKPDGRQSTVSKEELRRRAEALKIIGKIYEAAEPNPDAPSTPFSTGPS